MSAALRWYALRLLSNRERAVSQLLDLRGVEHYFPFYTEVVRWSDREKLIHRPLFPGYLFVRFDPACGASFDFPGSCGLVGFPAPLAIDDSEMERVRAVCASAMNPRPCAFSPGEAVQFETGPLAGVTGTIVEVKGAMRVIVAFEFLKRAISVTADASMLRGIA